MRETWFGPLITEVEARIMAQQKDKWDRDLFENRLMGYTMRTDRYRLVVWKDTSHPRRRTHFRGTVRSPGRSRGDREHCGEATRDGREAANPVQCRLERQLALSDQYSDQLTELVGLTEQWGRTYTEPRWFHELKARDTWKATGMPNFDKTFSLGDAEVFSPFVPLSVRDSANPVTVLRFSVRNTSQKSVAVSLAAWLKNAAFPQVGEQRLDRERREAGATVVLLGVQAAPDAPSSAAAPRRPAILFDDFERAEYGDRRTAMGEAFDKGPLEAEPVE